MSNKPIKDAKRTHPVDFIIANIVVLVFYYGLHTAVTGQDGFQGGLSLPTSIAVCSAVFIIFLSIRFVLGLFKWTRFYTPSFLLPDSCYFLGFSQTLISLIYSLTHYNSNSIGQAQTTLIEGFALAMISTLIGVFLRQIIIVYIDSNVASQTSSDTSVQDNEMAGESPAVNAVTVAFDDRIQKAIDRMYDQLNAIQLRREVNDNEFSARLSTNGVLKPVNAESQKLTEHSKQVVKDVAIIRRIYELNRTGKSSSEFDQLYKKFTGICDEPISWE